MVLEDSAVQKYLFEKFIPLFLDISHNPDLYERFNEDNILLHCSHTVSGNLLGTCSNPSPHNFLKNLTQYKQLSPRVTDPFEETHLSLDKPLLILEEIHRFQEKIGLISEITLSALLNEYDNMYRGWTSHDQKTYPHSALDFLLLFYQRSIDEKLYSMIIQTLRASYRGLHDKNRFGLFESANRDWSEITSYKKTLENNVAAARTLFHAFQITNDHYYLEKVQEIISFCLTDLWNSENGLFNHGILAHPNPNYSFSQQLFLSKEISKMLDIVSDAIQKNN
jgi:hypothetical protein